ncbi:MAG: sulfite exporter TauE/SafE family protein [Betaproteobacteria bacterium]|nr:sulfite exporter TauE/SafE family protein [Betaproteobacteria bacterium]
MGVSKGGFGSGLGIMATPLVALAVPTPQAAAIMLPILLVMDATGLVAYRGTFHRANLGLLLAGGVTGIALGALTFRFFSEAMIRTLLGAMALAFVVHRVRAGGTNAPAVTGSKAKGFFWSTLSGLASTIAHSGGPPLSVYLLPQKLDKAVLVGTTVVFFAVINAVKIVPYFWLGLFDAKNLLTSLVLAPLAPVGIMLGVWLMRRLSQEVFYRVAYTLLTLVGMKLLWDGVRGLAA